MLTPEFVDNSTALSPASKQFYHMTMAYQNSWFNRLMNLIFR